MKDVVNIAILEDDLGLLNVLGKYFAQKGHRPLLCQTTGDFFSKVSNAEVDVALLDVLLPQSNGITVMQELKKVKDVPAILMSVLDEEIDEITGLRMGAEDYIRKPFKLDVLYERVRIILNRIEQMEFLKKERGRNQNASRIVKVNTKIGALSYDSQSKEVKYDGHLLSLSLSEYFLLEQLLASPGHIKSREQLMGTLYHYHHLEISDRAIDAHIKRIRQKFRDIDPNFDMIKTVYGVGYKYEQE